MIVAAFILGLIFGSFATAVAYRVPRKESLGGRSRCPHCGTTISWTENIPLVSYAVQGGKCRHCGGKIHWRYPATESASGALFALAVARFGLSADAALFAAFFWVLVVLTVIDLEHKLLPNRVVYPAFVASWVALAAAAIAQGTPGRLIGAATGALIFGGFFTLVAFIYPAGMGGGDVKLAFVLGTWLGYLRSPGLVILGMFLSFLIGAIVGVVVMRVTKGGRKMQVPFGPFLALGTIVSVLVGDELLEIYLRGL